MRVVQADHDSPAGNPVRSSVSGGTDPNVSDHNGGTATELKPKTKPKTKKPSMYKVIMLNDDYTPMDFVVHVLERFFGISNTRAVNIMLTVHTKGAAVVGVFSYEIAETKVAQVVAYAQMNQHPLQCHLEKE